MHNKLIFITAIALFILGLFWLRSADVPEEQEPSRRVVHSAELSEDRERIIVHDDAGGVVFEYTIEEWREWANEHLEEALDEPVVIGDMPQPPENFSGFDMVVLSPEKDRLMFSVSTYAILTTVSLIGVLDTETQEFGMIAQSSFGGLGEVKWSPDGRYLAYTLDTARAHGDRVRVDDMFDKKMTAQLSGEDIIEHAGSEVEPNEFLPEIQDLEWRESGQILSFMTNDPGDEGTLGWDLDVRTGNVGAHTR